MRPYTPARGGATAAGVSVSRAIAATADWTVNSRLTYRTVYCRPSTNLAVYRMASLDVYLCKILSTLRDGH